MTGRRWRRVVEVLSPSTRRHDHETKMQRYAALGVAHYWIVDPEAKWVACHRLEGGAYHFVLRGEGDARLAHPDWPELIIPLVDLWR